MDEAWWRPAGMRARVSPKIVLKDLYAPAEDVLDKPGYYPRSKLGARWHLGFSAGHLGVAQGLLDFVLEYLPKQGTTTNPRSQRAVGEMQMWIAAARNVVYHAAGLWEGRIMRDAHAHSTHANLHNTAQSIGRAVLGLNFDSTEQQ